MISIKYNDAKFWVRHDFPSVGTRSLLMVHIVETEFGGKVNNNGSDLKSKWTVEFDNEENATAFRLTYGM
jgi:hypothetical protein